MSPKDHKQKPLAASGLVSWEQVKCFRYRRTHAESVVWADVIVLLEPAIYDDLGLTCSCEPLSIEHLAAERAVEMLVIPIFPR